MNSTCMNSTVVKTGAALQCSSKKSLAFAPLSRNARPASRRVALCVSATQAADQPPAVVAAANKMGFDLSEGIFGFTPFSELWVGRLAMSGFTIGLGTELATGKGILEQVGLSDGGPQPLVFAGMLALIGAATVIGTTKTVVDLTNYGGLGSLTRERAVRAASAMGLGVKAEQVQNEAADSLKVEVNEESLDEVLADPVDSTSQERMMTGMTGVSGYAEEVELNNGRWAMIGFAAAVLLEAQSGNGIVGQLINYGTTSGILGPDSGFTSSGFF